MSRRSASRTRSATAGWLALLGLLAIGCRAQPDGSAPSEPPPAVGSSGAFREMAADTGLAFRHFTGGTGRLFQPEIIGAGVALLDYDGDGDLDVYLLQGAMLDRDAAPSDAAFPPPPDYRPGNRLYRNDLAPGRALRFTDVTDEAGVGDEGYGMGAAVGDYDGDGDLDLYVTNFGSNVLYRNEGDGTFIDATSLAGADDPRWSTSATFTDCDRDGDLDLFVANYLDFTLEGHRSCVDATGAPDFCDPSVYAPVPDRLLRNDGRGRFTDDTERAGLAAAYGSGLGVTAADFDGDGWLDLYVANDGNANQLWRNLGGGRFADVALMAGAAYNGEGVAEAGMGVTAGDMDGDGDEDLFVTHLAFETNTLYLNDGRGDFRDVTAGVGLAQPGLRFTGFGSAWFDYDGDGLLDLFVANGAVTTVEALRGEPYPFHQPNQLFRNDASGRFVEVTAEAGPALALSEVSRGAAFGDIDNDGDVDIVVTNNNGPARLLINDIGNDRGWLGVGLTSDGGNREGLGARVGLLREGRPILWRRVHRDGSYLSSSDPRIVFGLGDDPAVSGVVVRWPDGHAERWRDVRLNTYVTLRRGEGEPWGR